MNSDVTILYQGGSGGFALFYYLLLSGKFVTGLDYTRIQDLIDQQYPDRLIQNPKLWKTKEFWPNNVLCKQSKSGPKLFLICNPMWDKHALAQNIAVSNGTYKILLYTDFKLQLRMCWEKQAYWFTDISKKAFDAPASTQQYLRQIIKTQKDGKDPMIERVVKTFVPDQQIELKQFVTTKSIEGFELPNTLQIEFLNRWIRLQPPKVQHVLSS